MVVASARLGTARADAVGAAAAAAVRAAGMAVGAEAALAAAVATCGLAALLSSMAEAGSYWRSFCAVHHIDKAGMLP